MRKIDCLIVLSLIAVGAGYWTQSGLKSTAAATPVRQVTPAPSKWQVDGVSLSDTPTTLSARLGPPTRVMRDSDVDQYWFKKGPDEVHVSYFHAEKSVGISGTCLMRDGVQVAAVNDTGQAVQKVLGEPMRLDKSEDTVAMQYEGARVYVKKGVVTGVVMEGYGAGIP